MKKALFFLSMLSIALFASAQTKLETIFKTELSLFGISVGTELPISSKFLTELNLGWGGVSDYWNDGIKYEFSEDSRSLFFRGQLRYYLNRERRFEKNRSLRNNAGSYIAY